MNPDYADRLSKKKMDEAKKSDNPLAAMNARKFDPSKSNVVGIIGNEGVPQTRGE